MHNYYSNKLYSQWGDRTADGICPDGTVLGDHPHTSIPILRPCRRNSCLQCARLRVKELTRAACYTEPSGLLGFSMLTWDYRHNCGLINRLGQYIRRDGFDTYWVWAAEPNPSGDGVHAHALSRGDLPPTAFIQRRANQVGIGRCYVEPITHHANLGYMCKLATWNEASLEAYRGVNGNILVHGSRFFGDPHTGETLSRRETATRQWALDHPHLARACDR